MYMHACCGALFGFYFFSIVNLFAALEKKMSTIDSNTTKAPGKLFHVNRGDIYNYIKSAHTTCKNIHARRNKDTYFQYIINRYYKIYSKYIIIDIIIAAGF